MKHTQRALGLCSRSSVAVLLLLFPFTTFAISAGQQPETIAELLSIMTQVAAFWIPWLMVLLSFFWNLATILFAIGDAEKLKQARPRIVWGILAMFVAFSVAGIVTILQITFLGRTP